MSVVRLLLNKTPSRLLDGVERSHRDGCQAGAPNERSRTDVGDAVGDRDTGEAISTYLGHVHVRDTYWYLTICPELMGLAVKRLERHLDVGL